MAKINELSKKVQFENFDSKKWTLFEVEQLLNIYPIDKRKAKEALPHKQNLTIAYCKFKPWSIEELSELKWVYENSKGTNIFDNEIIHNIQRNFFQYRLTRDLLNQYHKVIRQIEWTPSGIPKRLLSQNDWRQALFALFPERYITIT